MEVQNQKDDDSISKLLSPDEVLVRIGQLGRFQIRLILILCYAKMTLHGFQLLLGTFLGAEPPWRCVTNSSSCNITGSISPGEDGYKLRCSVPRDQWEFDTSEFTSIVSEWDLVCERSTLSSITKGVVFAGYMLGVIIGGVLSDKFGRKPLSYFPAVVASTLALVASFVNEYWIYALLRGTVGMFVGASSVTMFVLMMENIGVKHRAAAAAYLSFSWSIGIMILALLGYLIRDWRILSMTAALPGFVNILFWWFLPESSRWLIVKGKGVKAIESFRKIAKFNGKKMPENQIEFFEEKQRVGDLRDLFRSFNMAKITIVISFAWIIITLVFYGASFSAGIFGGNRYLVFFFLAAIELPAFISAVFLMNRAGRKKVMSLGLIISAIASLGAVLLQRDESNQGFFVGRIIMAVVSKYFICISFQVAYVYTAELFPTVVRSVGYGTASGSGRIGALCAPFIIWLVRIHILLPYSIFAISAFIAGVLSLSLPETNNKPTKETFELKERPLNTNKPNQLMNGCQDIDT